MSNRDDEAAARRQAAVDHEAAMQARGYTDAMAVSGALATCLRCGCVVGDLDIHDRACVVATLDGFARDLRPTPPAMPDWIEGLLAEHGITLDRVLSWYVTDYAGGLTTVTVEATFPSDSVFDRSEVITKTVTLTPSGPR